MRTIVTNNVLVREKASGARVLHVLGSAAAVYVTARDMIHQGWVLGSHPLTGGVSAASQPYRSLLMEPGDGPVSCRSLALIEAALHRMTPGHPSVEHDPDYQWLDYELSRDWGGDLA
ncbi:MAG: GrdX family protein [Bacillota bacterium]